MSESLQLIRQWQLLQVLGKQHYGISLKDLAHEFDVNERTIQRDLNVLQRVGFPVSKNTDKNQRNLWRLAKSEVHTAMQLHFEEAAALYLGQQFFEGMIGSPFYHHAHQAFKKIKSALSETAIEHLKKIANAYYVKQGYIVDYTQRAQLIDDILIAIEDRLISSASYRSLKSTEEASTADLHPYALVHYRNSIYLLAFNVEYQEIRHYKLDRISEFKSLQLKFNRPTHFDPQSHLEKSFGIFNSNREPETIRVRFSSEVKRHIEETQFHPSQQLQPQRDGSVIANFRLSSFEEIKSFILGFGHHAVVLDPPELLQMVQEEVEKMVRNYGLKPVINE